MDIAAWGIAPEDTFRAIGAILDLDTPVEINLVDINTCEPALREVIEREGVDICLDWITFDPGADLVVGLIRPDRLRGDCEERQPQAVLFSSTGWIGVAGQEVHRLGHTPGVEHVCVQSNLAGEPAVVEGRRNNGVTQAGNARPRP